MSDATLYPCPCCGYLVLDAEPPETYLACAICGWEDAEDVNDVPLRQAQLNFLEHGATLPSRAKHVRAPGPDDGRVPNWKPLAELGVELHARVLAAIEDAFGDLRHDGGWRLHEAELEDNYGTESEVTRARKGDDYTRWQEVPAKGIEQCDTALCYFEPAALRFHLPAYMTWALKHHKTSTSVSVDAAIYALERSKPDQALLDDAQRAAAALFLKFMAEHSEDHADEDVARRALEQHWHQYLPP